jgi:glycerol-3-phosphate dehydrogenase (NAD(P)+)
MKIAVLGAGAWGTALATVWAARAEVALWSREADHVAAMKAERENRAFFPGVPFPDGLSVVADMADAASAATVIVIATPVAGLRAVAASLAGISGDAALVWVCKGFEAGTALLPHQVVAQAAGPGCPGATLTGPSFALEVARQQPTAVTLAAHDMALAERLSTLLHTPRLRVYAHDDVIGAEVGGAVKNVMAIATGVCDGLQLGFNARAALITRGLAEIARLGEALGGRRDTFMGLAGVGDLMLTCTGDLSRNRQVGLGLASGKGLDEVLAGLGHVAEGVGTAREVRRLAVTLGIEMPITAAVVAMLDGALAPSDAVRMLLAREPKPEFR